MQQHFARKQEHLAVVLRNDALIVGELAVDELGHQLDVAEAELRLGRRQHDVERLVVVGQLARQFEHGLARQDDLEAVVVGRDRFGGIGEAVAVGGDHAYFGADHDHQQAVQVIADVLLRHGVLDQRQQAFELLLRQRQFGLLALGHDHARKVLRRQGLQVETALAGFQRQALFVERQADLGRFGQRPQDVLQLARADRHRRLFRPGCRGAGTDLDLDVGRQELESFPVLFHQHVGKYRQGVTFLDDATDRLQRCQNLVARAFK